MSYPQGYSVSHQPRLGRGKVFTIDGPNGRSVTVNPSKGVASVKDSPRSTVRLGRDHVAALVDALLEVLDFHEDQEQAFGEDVANYLHGMREE